MIKILKALSFIPMAFAFALFLGSYIYAIACAVQGVASAINPFSRD